MLQETEIKLEDLSHTGWSEERGYLTRGMRRKGERFESVRGESVFF